MAKVDLSKYGITGTTEVVYNPSYEQLFEEETKPSLEGYEVGKVSELGAVDVMTGIYTGRSPKDKFIVMDENSKNTVWWTSDEYKNDNHPASEEAWAAVKEIAQKELQNIITPDKPKEITPQLIIEVVSEHFQISLDQMISKNRSNEIARPRQIAMYLCKNMTDIPLDSIGTLLGGRDHSTIIHGINKISKELETNETTRNLIETIKKKINPN